MKLPELGIIALTPAAWTGNDFHPGIAIAAARAGAIGVLDLEYIDEAGGAELALDKLIAEAGAGGVGIRCGAEQVDAFETLIAKLAAANAASKMLILATRDKDLDKKAISHCAHLAEKKHLLLAVEAINLDEAKLAQQAGAHLVIAKGHESAGRVGQETSFVLLQRLCSELDLPVWVRGGIGPHTAAAALAAGCAGVVLDSQLLLLRESPLSVEQKEKISNFDGTETELFGIEREYLRLWVRPGAELSKTMQAAQLNAQTEAASGGSNKHTSEVRKPTSDARKHHAAEQNHAAAIVRQRMRVQMVEAARASKSQLPAYCLIGQDIAFALPFARRYASVAAAVNSIRNQARENIRLAAEQEILTENSPLAASNGTLFPILQGAMTRVSDTAEFAHKVAEGGALPFLALALMRKDELEPLLEQCVEKLAGLSWGVGMLGFVPAELRQEQLQLVLKHRPTCALIAGGRPDQAKELENAGIKTYLHVPSPALLESFVELGTRRFIFEGKECGGHVGPRSSFVLWESMIDTLMQCMPPKADPSEFHVVFAGGIHDKISSAMLAAMAAPLAQRGVRIGVLMGTAYLFTKEAVTSGAIVPKFQEAALACDETVLLETGPGHAIRCVNSPYKEIFDEKRKKMEADGLGKNELREELELMNLGRLRVASKGLARGEAGSASGSKLVKISADKQWSDGMYMIGQVAVMHDKTTTIKELHQELSSDADAYLKSLSPKQVKVKETEPRKQDDPIAIIGMSCLFPKANDLETFWQNIINKVDCIEEIPQDQWDWSSLYSEDALARDKIYSKWGGFLRDIPFDPSVYGIPPSSLASVDPMQLLILEVTRAALQDAGYQSRQFPREKTSIVLANAGHGPITAFYSLRSMLDWTLSDLDPAYRATLEKRLPEWTEDSFPGYLGNVVAGRVANRFDLGGLNFCVDAACASSLAALYTAVRELRAGASDLVLLAATDTHNQPGDYLSFSKTHALSPRGHCRTFDATADGIVISEGMAVIVLKRLSDAQRDGDRVYAVVKGVGGSSDGRDLSLTAPRPGGQMLALNRAYEDANLSAATVELVEAHGTGTVAGDRAEVEALRTVFEKAGAQRQVCALGSVKTMIGHTKCAAGLASIIKVARALYHKVLPPTIGVETPNPSCNFDASPFYVNTEARPWLHDSEALGYPRRAGVSAFGFGGTNFHTILEEYQAEISPRQDSALRNFPTEVFTFRSASRAQLQRNIDALETSCKKLIELEKQAHGPLSATQANSLFDLAYRHHLAQNAIPANFGAEGKSRLSLAIVASSSSDLLKKLAQFKETLQDESKKSFRDPRGVFFNESEALAPGAVAFLFPGQGSQQINMLRDLSLCFAEVRETFERGDKTLADKFEQKLSRFVFPAPAFTEDERLKQSTALTDTHVAQPAVAAADLAALKLLREFGLKPDLCAGHSFGEYVALTAAGVMTEADLFKIAEQRGAILKSANDKSAGSMTAVSANGAEVRRLIANLKDVTLANINSPKQCIIAGDSNALAQASRVLDEHKVKTRPIAVSAAFHSPLMEPAQKQLSKALHELQLHKATVPVYSNTLAKPYPVKTSEIASLLSEHLVKPVEFQKQIEEMYEAGARIFIECGPGSILSSLVDDILEGKEHLALSLERNGKNGITQLEQLLAQAFVAGLEPDFGKLYKHRVDALLPRHEAVERSKPKLTYLINGSHIKRYDGKIAVASSRPTEQALLGAQRNGANGDANAQATGGAQAQATGTAAGAGQATAAQSASTKNATIKSATTQQAASATPIHGAAQTHSAAAAQTAAQNGNTPAASPNRVVPAPGYPKPGNAAAIPGNGTNPAHPTNVQAGATANSANLQGRAGREQVMLEFQRCMTQMTNNFLQTQERVMVAYLGNGQAQASEPGRGSGAEPQMRAQVPFYPANMQAQVAMNTEPARAELEADTLQYDKSDLAAIQAAKQGGQSEAGQAAALQASAGVSLPPAAVTGKNATNNRASSGGLDAEALIQQLIHVVSERTGYPAEMLDPTLDLEADLGIDSIKRVEILNNFRKLLPEDVQTQLETGIEKLAGTKTLQGIMDWIRSDLAPSGIAAPSPNATAEYVPPDPASTNTELAKAKASYLARALVTLKALEPLTKNKPELSGLYLITDSEDGLAEALAAKLVSAGAETLILRHRNADNLPAIELPASRVELDLCREEMVRAFAKKVSEKYDQVAGLIHLLPLHPKLQETPVPSTRAANFAIPRSLLVLSRELLLPLLQAGQEVKLFATTSLGGGFGYGEQKNFNPVHASIPGMLKTFAREFPLSIVRSLDFASTLAQSSCAESIVAELGQDNKELIEVAYSEKGRFTLEATPTEIEPGTLGKIKLEQHSLVLVTGGARGITAELCVELGERHKPTFVIIGRGTKPAEAEDPEYKGLSTPREIKAVIMDKLRRAGAVLNVPAVESVYQKLLKDREIRNNLARLEATGSRVIYYALDVRDQVALTALIDRLYDSFGKIDAVIHGAGVIEDALIKDKTLASFDRVFGTKVESALTLASRLQLDKLKYLIFFSSVVGRTGNAGQCDYVAANEVLNKLALKLNAESTARVLSIGWGPWRGGMAQDDLEEVFARYGWSMIEVQEGRNAFYNELRFGGKGNAEVLLVGQIQKDVVKPVSPGSDAVSPDSKTASPDSESVSRENESVSHESESVPPAYGTAKSAAKNGDKSAQTPSGGNGGNGGNNGAHGADLIRERGTRLQRAEVLEQDSNNLKIRLRIDPEFDIYLKDHAFDGMPVLPMAVASELLAETAQFMYPNMKLIRLERMDIPSGVMFDSGARDLYLTLAETSRSEEEIHADLSLCIAPNSTRKNFIARAVLRSEVAPPPKVSSKFPLSYKKQEIADLETPPKVVDVYTNWLFHGPLFQGISTIDAMGRNGIEGELRSTPIEDCLKEVPAEPWIVDPLLLDSGMQLAGVWARNYMGLTALPTGYGALYIMAPIRGEKFRAIVQIPEESKNGQLRCDLAIYDEAGNLLIVMEDLGGVGSKALNRLGATPKPLRSK